MNIRDIVNRDLVNLTNCDQEPIHIPGSIQPHGLLIGINVFGIIDFCSGNVAALTGFTHQQLLGQQIVLLFNKPDALSLLSAAADHPQSPVSLELNGRTFSCFVHRSNEVIIAEFEPVQIQPLEMSELYNLSLESINSLRSSDSLKELAQRISGQIKKLTGYDRVMIYRFDEQYNGEVFAESCEANLEPFLGLHYPHTDIPAQARALYTRNLLRLIVDVNYIPSPIFTIDDTPGKNLDLGMASLRSVSPIHIEYLQNIGVTATLTISLLHENRLWGLVACHHYTGTKLLSAYTRVSAQLMSNLLTSQIQVREVADEYMISKSINRAMETLLSEVNEFTEDFFETIVNRPSLTALCHAGGVAIVFNNKVYSAGVTPSVESIGRLSFHLKGKSDPLIYATRNLAHEFDSGELLCSTAAGILYHHLEGMAPNDCIIWFRPETNEEVNWAGDPDKAIIINEKGLSPRNSFALYKQIIKCQGSPWQKPEITGATSYVHVLQKHIHMYLLKEEEIKYRELSIQLKDANEELENINWISTHDLKEPLRKIQLFSSRLLEKEKNDLSEMMVDALQRMNQSANRMQQLITDITDYARIRHSEEGKLSVDLKPLLQDLITEVNLDNPEAKVTILSGLPTIIGVPVLLNQLFVNLIRNAIKFSRQDVIPEISINYQPDQPFNDGLHPDKRYDKVIITDNGIGIPDNQLENIFKVFTRLHTRSDYAGSGIGLALCKQIMQIHKGYITAETKPGGGAVFNLYFPVIKKNNPSIHGMIL